jgi:fluoroacetyl-CoA thioesterase
MRPDLIAGQRFSWHTTIPPRATVPALYEDTPFCRDMPDVLATGYLVGMMELACLHGLMPYVDWPREQSLGTMVNFRHLAPTLPGATLRIEGEVLAIEGRTIRFKAEAWDGDTKVCEGSHERTLIDPVRFEAKLQARAAS